MKKNIKKLIPLWLENHIRYFLSVKYFKNDSLFLKKAHKNKKFVEEQLLRSITEYYHAIEKGLIKKNFREGFGKNAISNLFNKMNIYSGKGFSTENIRFKTALSVLDAYLYRHKDSNVDIMWVKIERAKFHSDNQPDIGGTNTFEKSYFSNNSKLTFPKLVKHRVSVRDFSIIPVNNKIIEEAIDIAMSTPSVCNRQGWFVRIIREPLLIKEIFELQGGFRGHGANTSHLILISSLNNYFRYPTERHQGFIDAGMFSMSLMYSLTSLGVASCPLNSNFKLKEKNILYKILNIESNESLVMFLALGNYPETILTTKSHRDPYKEKIKYY